MLLTLVLNWLKKIGWPQALGAGVCLGIGFIVPALWFLSIAAIAWLAHILHSDAPYKKIIAICTLVWGIKSLSSIVWFWSTLPIGWVEGMSTAIQVTTVGAYWLSSGLWLSSGGFLFGAVAVCFMRQTYIPRYVVLVLLPFLWLTSELCGAGIFSIFTAGPGSFLQTYFSFGMVGYLLGVTSIGVWLAVFFGVYGLTVVMVTLPMTMYIMGQRASRTVTVSLFALLYAGFTYGILPTTDAVHTSRTVITVDTQFDAQFLATENGDERKASTLATAVNAAVKLQPNVILLPEDSRYLASQFDSTYPKQAMSQFQFTHGNTETIVIDSGRYTTRDGVTVVRANVFDGLTKKLWQFDKQYLVPQGEYVPTLYGTILRVLGYGEVVDSVSADSAYRPGPLMQTSNLPDYVPAVLFCFESVSPSAGLTLKTTRNVPFIAHPISHAWFHDPQILWRQLDVMLQLQARYSGVPIVSAGNMTMGKLYLPSGEIKAGTVVGGGELYVLQEFRF